MKRLILFAVLFLAVAAVGSPALLAQGNSITIAIPSWGTDVIDDERVADFEAEYGVDVVIESVSPEDLFFGGETASIEDYLEAVNNYAARADVLVVQVGQQLTVTSTRGGYFLDLAPLTVGDALLNSDDFYPVVWEDVQWEGGVWALPIALDVQTTVYNQTEFDALGLPYPDASWTLTDYAEVGAELVQRDDQGVITRPAMLAFTPGEFYATDYGQTLYDPFTLPYTPDLSSPDLETLLDQWIALQDEGVIGDFSAEIDFATVPITMQNPYFLEFSTAEGELVPVLLPGGAARMQTYGLSVSAGTQSPELAYALARYLSLEPGIGALFFSPVPARQSFVGNEEALPEFFPALDPEIQALIDEGLQNPISYIDLIFSDYLDSAVSAMRDEGLQARAALDDQQQTAVDNLQAAEDQRENVAIAIPTPAPTAVLAQGEVVIEFGYSIFGTDLPNEEAWETTAQEFAAADPQVGEVRLQSTGFTSDANEIAQEYDCFYSAQNLIYNVDLANLISLDPFMSADPNFDQSDFLTGTLTQVQLNEQTWAYPVTIQPEILRYDTQAFSDANVPAPIGGWAVDQFNDALIQLQAGEDPVFASRAFGGSYILMLTASYGGLPIDFRTVPPTFNLTDTNNVEALRQVLDLARDGYINYTELSLQGGGFGAPPEEVAIYNETLGLFNFGAAEEEGAVEYGMTTYPAGSQYIPISYNLGTAYIGVNAENADACYRWISTIAARPELFEGMPTRRSLVDDPALLETQGQDAVDAYAAFFEQLESPNAVVFPNLLSANPDSINALIAQQWVYNAFNEYVLEDGDLEAALTDAQTKTDQFFECTATLPPLDFSLPQEELQDQVVEIARCAVSVDPELESLFGPLLEDDGE